VNPINAYWQIAKTGQWPAVEAEMRRRAFAGAEQRSRQHSPRLERARNLTVLFGHVLEREEREP
jgi:hypothetical protein